VVIAGHDGGTALAAVLHQACWRWGNRRPTQQTLVLNRLRGRIRVQARMKTGRDVVIGALLGDEFGFARLRWWWKAAS
jgi:glutamate synthase domain-containing protein 2